MRPEDSIAHLHATDPAGSFVVEDAGEVVGFAQAARREDLWFLGKLFVRPASQALGVGKQLLDLAVAYGSDSQAGMICSTPDPRALRRYGRLAGFEVHPMFTAAGVPRQREIFDTPSVRPGTSADFELAAEVDREIRRGPHGADLPFLLGRGCTLFVIDDRGYAVAGETGPQVVAARDTDAAADLLRACLRSCQDGAEAQIARIGGGHQWALRVALDAGLVISPGGGLVIRKLSASAAYLPDNVFC